MESKFALPCSSCILWAWLPGGMWNLPGPGIEPMSSELTGRLLTTGPPEKSLDLFIINKCSIVGHAKICLSFHMFWTIICKAARIFVFKSFCELTKRIYKELLGFHGGLAVKNLPAM